MYMPESGADKQAKEIDEYHKLELQEIFVRTRTLVSLRVQLFSFMATAHLTILGIAFTSKQSILIFFAASLMGLLLTIDLMLMPIIDAIVARGLQIEKIYSNDRDTLCTSIISASFRNEKKANIVVSKIREANNQKEIIKLIQSRPTNKIGIWLPLMILCIESIGGLIVWHFHILPLF